MDNTAKLVTDTANSAKEVDVLTALASMPLAIAVVCHKEDTVLFVTNGMQAVLPTLQEGKPWRDSLRQDAKLLSAINKAFSSNIVELTEEIEINAVKHRVAFKKCNSNQMAISIQSTLKVDDNLHEYMLARDNLFSTSRTISVSEMATTLAHELNTPIGTISNILRGVKMRLKKPDASLEAINTALDQALEQTKFSQNIISRIRDFTQSRRPKLNLLDVRQQVHEAVTLLDWLLSHSQCRVELQVPDEPLYISGDATMLQQVLINLIRNAVDAMHQQRTALRVIVINATQTDLKVTLSIADTGHGLAENEDKLFVPFATNKASGMGVGLNICRSFIELHQGRLWLSPNEAEGCTCFVELPAASLEDSQRRSSQ